MTILSFQIDLISCDMCIFLQLITIYKTDSFFALFSFIYTHFRYLGKKKGFHQVCQACSDDFRKKYYYKHF